MVSPIAFSMNIKNISNVEILDKTADINPYYDIFSIEKTIENNQRNIFFVSNLESLIKPSLGRSEEINFSGHSNEHIFIVKITSQEEIHFDNFDYYISEKIVGIKESENSGFQGCLFINGTNFYGLTGGWGYGGTVGNLRYFHLNLTKRLKYSYEDRGTQIWNNSTVQSLKCPSFNITIPSGTWYLIFTGVIFDLQPEDYLTSIKVWINISSRSSDIEILSYEGGKHYGIWYGEFDANLIISKFRTFEMMLNGKVYFNVTNNLLFKFLEHPEYHGFWNLKWDTPNGKRTFHMKMREGKWYFKNNDESDYFKNRMGVLSKGEYHLTTSYFDYSPEEKRARVPYFIGLDVELR